MSDTMFHYRVKFVADYFVLYHGHSSVTADEEAVIEAANEFLKSQYGVDFASLCFSIEVEGDD
jgi:hypothetical protein